MIFATTRASRIAADVAAQRASTWLSQRSSAQLKHAAFLVGLSTTGTKPELVSSLVQHVLNDRCDSRPRRILSVDMGIRNLAYCLVEPRTHDHSEASPISSGLTVPIWRKRDLLQTSSGPEGANGPHKDGTSPSPVLAKAAVHAFTPSVLSETAYSVTQELLSCEPDVILIERQRFRSGGAAAIQEWTVRVNMLESMLWACLRALSKSSVGAEHGSPALYEVSPARVAQFWTARPGNLRLAEDTFEQALREVSSTSTPTQRRARVQKKDKIAIVRSWLAGSDDVPLALTGEAAALGQVFSIPGGHRRAGHSEHDVGKLDDLADCLLQAAAWRKWHENIVTLRDLLVKHDSDNRF